MEILRIKIPETGQTAWLVLDEQYTPILPIVEFLDYKRIRPESPNTVRAYAFALKLFWEFLQEHDLEWTVMFKRRARLHLARFREWLVKPRAGGDPRHPRPARKPSTVKLYNTAVRLFYKYYLENEPDLAYSELRRVSRKRSGQYRPMLAHIQRGHSRYGENNRKWYAEDGVSVGQGRRKTLTPEQVEVLLKACNSKRDKFLVALLYRSGFRIGQALGLRHEDIVSWDNVLHVVPRNDNVNGARAKVRQEGTVHIEPEVLALYTDYILEELENIESDYVFVNLSGENIGKPLEYPSVYDLFRRLQKKTGIFVTPHMFRHTHSTEYLKSGNTIRDVQERLLHTSPETTQKIYIHTTPEETREAHRRWVEWRTKS
ncbi:MAG TPA: tyrosine-type recombinase/integrase [Chloroflexia bacterium]|jgi:integrase